MNHALTTLARARYRPARLSVLAPWALERTPAERLARDVSLRWEEAADAFLEALLALGSGRGLDRSVDPAVGAGRRRSPGGRGSEEAAGGGARRWGPGVVAPGRARPDLEEEEGEAPFPEVEEASRPGTFRAPPSRDTGALETGSRGARPRASGPRGEVGGRPGMEAGRPGEPPALPRDRPVRPVGFEAPGHAMDAGGGRGAQPLLSRPDLPDPAPGGVPTRRGRAEALPEAGPPARGNAPSAFAGPPLSRPLARRSPGPSAAGPREAAGLVGPPREDAGDSLPSGRAFDPFALEALLDDLRRRDEALEEWARTGF